jgi:signal transduction histidine kinase
MVRDTALAWRSRRRELVGEIQVLTIILPAFIIVAVVGVSLAFLSCMMVSDLRRRSVATADETSELLAVPLYTVDDAQARRIGEALLSSGRISGIVLDSIATGTIISVLPMQPNGRIPPLERNIASQGIQLGTVRLHFSDSQIVETRRRFSTIAAIMVAAIVILNLLASRFLFRKMVQEPTAAIFDGIRFIAEGNYDLTIPETAYHDVNAFVGLINDMAGKILSKNDELKEANSLLERRVSERTAELTSSLAELKRAQDCLIESEKLSALGHLSAGMVHELNTPLGAIISSNGSLISFLENRPRSMVEFAASLTAGQRRILESVVEMAMARSADLKMTRASGKNHRQLLAGLREAGIPEPGKAAELLDELDLGDSFSDLLECLRDDRGLEMLSFAVEMASARYMAQIVSVAAGKAANVVKMLRSYLEPSSAEGFQPVDVVESLETVLALMAGWMKNGIQVRRNFSRAVALGSADRLDQVWMNLIRNAVQAMEFSGELALSTTSHGGEITVSIGDTGPGIPQDVGERIFEPFFSTKKRGDGMGLGLDICKRIVETHRGTLSFESEPGETVFKVTLPEFTE